MRFRDYSWDRCQEKALLFGNMLRWHLKVKIWMQSHGLESVKRAPPTTPHPTLPKPVLLALSKNRMWLQQSTQQIICTDNRPLTSFNLPAYWNSILLAMVIKGTKKRTASFFLFFFWSQLESYKSICWRGKKINSRHLSVSNIWWYVGMLFMLTIFRYHTVRNKASHIAFSPYN